MLHIDLQQLEIDAMNVDKTQFYITHSYEERSGMSVGMPTEWTEISMPGVYNGSSIRLSSEEIRSKLKRVHLGKLILLALQSGGIK